MVTHQPNWRATQIWMVQCMMTGKPYLDILSYSMGAQCHGAQRNKIPLHCQQQRQNTWQQPMLPMRHSDSNLWLGKFLGNLPAWWHFTEIIRVQLHSLAITNTTPRWNTSTFVSISYAGLSLKENSNLFIAPWRIWLLTPLQKPSQVWKSSTSLTHFDYARIEGECWSRQSMVPHSYIHLVLYRTLLFLWSLPLLLYLLHITVKPYHLYLIVMDISPQTLPLPWVGWAELCTLQTILTLSN